MQGSLLLLSKLQFLGAWRKLKRSMGTPKGIILTVVVLAFAATIVLPRLFVSTVPPEVFGPIGTLIFHPAALFAFWVFTLIGGGIRSPIAFSMAEVEFLFGGPFSRRQLLVHKLAASTLGPLGFAVITPFAFPFVWWPAATVGVLLMTSFAQWSTIAGALVMGWIGARYRALRWIAALALLAAAIASFWQAGLFAAGADPNKLLPALESSWAARIVLAPFVVFSRVITAETAGPLVSWGLGALAMNVAVVIAILSLDGQFQEASLKASRRRFENLERMKRSGGATFRVRSRPRFTIPCPPRMFGAGPIAWRQGLETLRSSGGPVLLVFVPVVIGMFAMMVVAVAPREETPAASIIVSVTLFVGLLITMSMPLGLRSELDHVDIVRTLPIGSNSIVFGSLASAVAYVTLVQAAAVVGAAVVLGEWIPAVPLAMALALSSNVVMVAFDGVLVVLFPSIRRFVPGDLLVGVRIMLVSIVKILFVLAAAVLAVLPVIPAAYLFPESLAALVATACAVLFLEGLVTAWIAAFLYARFDPSNDPAEVE